MQASKRVRECVNVFFLKSLKYTHYLRRRFWLPWSKRRRRAPRCPCSSGESRLGSGDKGWSRCHATCSRSAPARSRTHPEGETRPCRSSSSAGPQSKCTGRQLSTQKIVLEDRREDPLLYSCESWWTCVSKCTVSACSLDTPFVCLFYALQVSKIFERVRIPFDHLVNSQMYNIYIEICYLP